MSRKRKPSSGHPVFTGSFGNARHGTSPVAAAERSHEQEQSRNSYHEAVVMRNRVREITAANTGNMSPISTAELAERRHYEAKRDGRFYDGIEYEQKPVLGPASDSPSAPGMGGW